MAVRRSRGPQGALSNTDGRNRRRRSLCCTRRPYTSRGPASIESEGHHRVAERITELKAQGTVVPAVGNDIHAIVAYDHRAHKGLFVDVGHGEVAQHVGRDEYVMYDVAEDLHGVKPPEGVNLDVNAQGRVGPAHGPALGQGRVTRLAFSAGAFASLFIVRSAGTARELHMTFAAALGSRRVVNGT